MKIFSIVFFLGVSLFSFGQNDEFMVWTKAGVGGDLLKKTDWMFDLSARFDDDGLATFFPQAGIEYKVKKWFKPSLEYRLLIDKNKYGNYKSSNRLNINAEFKGSLKRFDFDTRIRYQYAFERFGAADSYDADFDQAFRFKPSVSYDIKKSIFKPAVSAELFYNPALGEDGRQFNKMRLAIGTKLDFDGPHGLSVKYQIDKKFHNYQDGLRHVVALSYEYKI